MTTNPAPHDGEIGGTPVAITDGDGRILDSNVRASAYKLARLILADCEAADPVPEPRRSVGEPLAT